MDIKKLVGSRIKELRKAHKLTQSEFYDTIIGYRSDTGRKTVYNWEQGNTEIDYENIIKICDTFGCSADYLLGRINEKTVSNHIIHKSTGLTEQAIEALSEWNCNDNQESFFPYYLSCLITDEKFYEILKNITEMCASAEIFTDLQISNDNKKLQNNLLKEHRALRFENAVLLDEAIRAIGTEAIEKYVNNTEKKLN